MMTTANGGWLDWRTKGLWLPDGAVSVADFAAAGHDLFTGPFTWPVMTLSRSAVTANIATFAAYCARHGVRHAPHAKTTMAASLVRAQLAAGAWAITAATAGQALALRRLGVPRVLLANQLLDARALRWAVAQARAGWEFACWVDSAAGVRALAAALTDETAASDAAPGRLDVLVEVGHPGGRTGCRTVAEAVAVARAAATVPGVRVAGVAGYEGGLPDADAVRRYLATLRAAAPAVADAVGPAGADPFLLSAGGSAYVDVVVEETAGGWLPGRPSAVVLRSGAYVTHDDGFYAARTPFPDRTGGDPLRSALRLWAQVLSAPEPGLAIVGMGRRDVSHDSGLPVPLRVRGLDGRLRPAGDARVTALNDQHAYVAVGDDTVEPGELVCFGISHPCTAIDKWRTIPVVDDEDRVVDVVQTYF